MNLLISYAMTQMKKTTVGLNAESSSFLHSSFSCLSPAAERRQVPASLSLNPFLSLPNSSCLETHHGQMLLEWQSLFVGAPRVKAWLRVFGRANIWQQLSPRRLLEPWTESAWVSARLRRGTRWRTVPVFTLNPNNAVPKVCFCTDTVSSAAPDTWSITFVELPGRRRNVYLSSLRQMRSRIKIL